MAACQHTFIPICAGRYAARMAIKMAKTEILLLNEEELIECGVIDFPHCVDVLEEMFKLLGEGDDGRCTAAFLKSFRKERRPCRAVGGPEKENQSGGNFGRGGGLK